MNFERLKSYMDTLVAEFNTPGVDCIVYKEHKMVFRYYAGMRDLEKREAMNGNELYFIFSMTKMMISVSALQLFERGKFQMSDPVSKYLPEFEKMRIAENAFDGGNADKITSGVTAGERAESFGEGYAKNPITIRDLFTMQAGLDYDLNADYIKTALSKGETSTEKLVRAMSEAILGFEPGTRFRYSICYDVLGGLIEVWSQMSLGEYMKKNLFEPLELKNTFFGTKLSYETLSKMAARYMYDEKRKPVRLPLECPYTLSEEYESGGAGLVSCTADYAIFLDALANCGTAKNRARILSPSTVELMGTNHLKGKSLEDFQKLRSGYGYGLGVRTHIDKTKSGSLSPIGEFGWDGAAGAFSMVDTKNKLSLTYFQHIHGWEVKIQTGLKNALYADFESEIL